MNVYLREGLRSLFNQLLIWLLKTHVGVVTSGGFVSVEHCLSLMIKNVMDYRES